MPIKKDQRTKTKPKRASAPRQRRVMEQPTRVVIEIIVKSEGGRIIVPIISSRVAGNAIGLPPAGGAKSDAEIEKDVKQFILVNSPKTDLTIEDLVDGDKLKENLDYQSDDYDTLQIDLNRYVNEQKPSQHVLHSEVTSNKTVGSIVKMVKDKLK